MKSKAWRKAVPEAGVDAVIVQDVGSVALAREVAWNYLFTRRRNNPSRQQMVLNLQRERRHEGCCRKGALYPGDRLSREGPRQKWKPLSTALYVYLERPVPQQRAWGGRSANRGQCPACRLPYAVVVDGSRREGLQYALSPGDLCGSSTTSLPQLKCRSHCFKIEGRLKDERYVAATTRAYREAIDAVWDHTEENTVTRNDLLQVFARGQDSERDGLTPGFLRGPKHQSLVVGNAPRHRGVFAGRLAKSTLRSLDWRL